MLPPPGKAITRSSVPFWRRLLWPFALWTAIGLLSSAQYYSFYLYEGQPYPIVRVTLIQMLGWYLWGLLAPLIRFLGRRFRVERKRWLVPAALHLHFGVVIALTHLTGVAYFRLALRPPMGTPTTPSFLTTWLGAFASSFHFELLTYLVILGAGYSLELYGRYREREVAAAQLEKQLAQAQLQALRMQLHPHFLFNTLHTIAVLVRKEDNQTAVRMISGLSDLLRYVLRQGDVQEISVKQEIDFIEQYLELEQLRFRDRMRVRFEIAPETLDARVPNLILQPLVENAVRHGIAAKADAGLIAIKSWRHNGRLWLEVEDDGRGLDADWRQDRDAGVGLSNTLARLQRLYEGEYEFTCTAAPGRGVVARVGIPFRPVFETPQAKRRNGEDDPHIDRR